MQNLRRLEAQRNELNSKGIDSNVFLLVFHFSDFYYSPMELPLLISVNINECQRSFINNIVTIHQRCSIVGHVFYLCFILNCFIFMTSFLDV